ncbi:uncharacterized protein ACLA_061630 [Aspergillus clavatus NRRL 1]|uniref:Uncharacterized protein n=1 Tax=Aspergillus clavatus (strain ATCC 1007 / CBS 513.65 / DSM 816 / NCTC 3887 / NRRL 1 / QM 1276 / 107) TaxID=344612 RepID=A1CCE4_ASPCL|nr:uncharacterized protein ACLA_061630 [Aspergillus clavatus NRRL 1]EAW12201.1 hypothetical protein ACLA_061630 [Aspergillus clavatus NRRL 1]
MSAPAQSSPAEPSGIMSGLKNYITHPFTSMDSLIPDAHNVLDCLNQHEDSGNQFILILNLPKPTLVLLDEDKNALDGVEFRFMFEGTTGFIKIVPSYTHNAITRRLALAITYGTVRAGAPDWDFEWAQRTTFSPTVAGNKGKWFENSRGAVRYVLTLSVQRAQWCILLEKWQLSPPGQQVDATMASGIQQMTVPPMPPLGFQQPAAQCPFAAQRVTITPSTASGSTPLYLQFQALFDRVPTPAESDVQIGVQNLVNVAKNL